MRLLAIDDLEIDQESFYERPMITDQSNRLAWSTRRRQGIAGSAFFGGQPEPATWNVLFRVNDLETRDALLAVLGGDVTEERRMLAMRGDVAQTRVIARAAPLKIVERNELDVSVDFESSDSVWLSESAEETVKTFISTLDQAMHLVVPGNTRTAPRIIITPTAQRTTSTATAGWKYRRRYIVANLADEPMYNYPIRISLGDTTPLTTTKAQADGDDLRIVIDGIEVERTLVTWDTAASFVWCIIDALPDGESMTIEVWYGNPNATNPPVLAYPNLPPFTLSTSTNAAWIYPQDDVAANKGLGLWHLSKGVSGAVADYTVPGAWHPLETFPIATNNDDHGQPPYYVYLDSGTWAMASLYAFRVASGSTVALSYPTAQDGVGIVHPLGIVSLTATIQFLNQNGSGRLSLLVRDSSAELWHEFFADTTTHNTTASVGPTTYTPAGITKQLAIAAWPANITFMPEGTNDIVNVISDGTWTLTIDSSKVSITGGAEEEIYELATELRLGGGADRVAPYRSLLIGNARGEAGAGVPRVGILLNQALVIDGEELTHDVYDNTLIAKIEAVSAHAVRPILGFDSYGTTEEGPSNLLLPLAPPRTHVPNGDFAADLSNWIAGTTTAGVTATRSWDGAVGGEQGGSLSVAITPNTAGAGAQAETVNTRYFSINDRESVEVSGWSQTNTANITPRLRITWYDDDQALLSNSTEADWTPVINTPYRRTFAARVPAGAVLYRIVALAYIDGAAATGTVWFDDITTNDVELIVADVAMGQLDVTVSVQGRWL